MRSLNQALNHGLILKKVHRVIQFNQEVWFKPYINMNIDIDMNTDMNTEL